MAYLDSHPPARSQFRDPRREDPSGVVVVHTAENVMDSVGPDTGAEGVANFIRTRTTPGSYHDLVDSDSIVDVVRYECEAFQDGTGSNPHAYAVSAACSYLDWAKMSKAKRDAFVENMAQAAARYARWVKKHHGVTIPARRITRAQSDARVPGFISHAERDPARRKDPGNVSGQFPWTQFLTRFAQIVGYTSTADDGEDEMLTFAWFKDDRPATTAFKPVAGTHLYAVTHGVAQTAKGPKPSLIGGRAVHQTTESWAIARYASGGAITAVNPKSKPLGAGWMVGMEMIDGPLAGV